MPDNINEYQAKLLIVTLASSILCMFFSFFQNGFFFPWLYDNNMIIMIHIKFKIVSKQSTNNRSRDTWRDILKIGRRHLNYTMYKF